MMMKKIRAVLVLMATTLWGLSAAAANGEKATDRLRHELEYIFSDPSFATAHWGVVIQSLKTGEFIYMRNENKAFMPASNMKLFTTAAALLTLGAEYTFTTRLFADGKLDSLGVLQGDLVVLGSGDPSLSGRWAKNKITLTFERWADSLKARGIKAVNGRLIGDDRYFTDEPLGAGWSWDYLSDWYSAQISALTFNDNCVDIIFNPGDTLNAPATYRLEPNTGYVQIINRVVTGRRTRIAFRRHLGGNRIVCNGTLSIYDRNYRDWITVDNPGKYAVTVLQEILTTKGIFVNGPAVGVEELADYPLLPANAMQVASHASPPLSEIVKVTNKDSQNLFAELLLRTVGRVAEENGSAESGAGASKRLFERMGIVPEHLSIADGSGLSRLDLITPLSMIKLLRYMRQQSVGEVFYASLPIAGVDGTLKGRMRYTNAKNNVRAKTGYIGRVRALSGYVTTRDQEELVFAMIVNNYAAPTETANYIQDLVCERLANFSRQ